MGELPNSTITTKTLRLDKGGKTVYVVDDRPEACADVNGASSAPSPAVILDEVVEIMFR